MSEKIEPALSAKEWATLESPPHAPYASAPRTRSQEAAEMLAAGMLDRYGDVDVNDPVRGIALLNDIMPESDPRKITREKIGMLRDTADELTRESEFDWKHAIVPLRALADALESYLPPIVP